MENTFSVTRSDPLNVAISTLALDRKNYEENHCIEILNRKNELELISNEKIPNSMTRNRIAIILNDISYLQREYDKLQSQKSRIKSIQNTERINSAGDLEEMINETSALKKQINETLEEIDSNDQMKAFFSSMDSLIEAKKARDSLNRQISNFFNMEENISPSKNKIVILDFLDRYKDTGATIDQLDEHNMNLERVLQELEVSRSEVRNRFE
jgi:molecular chaperone DnaK (HSP70)